MDQHDMLRVGGKVSHLPLLTIQLERYGPLGTEAPLHSLDVVGLTGTHKCSSPLCSSFKMTPHLRGAR